MKKLLFILSLGLTSTLSNGQNLRYDTIRYAKAYYAERVALFKSEPIKKGRVILLGNSITEFGDWKKLLNDSTIVNRGIAGDNTFGVLDRLNDVIVREPNKLFIKIGINDIAQDIPVDLIVKNVMTIVTRVKNQSPGTQIYVHSILPTNDNVKNEYPDAFHKNDIANRVNEKVKQQATPMGFVYIDLSKALSDKHGNLDVRYAEADGLHLNPVGYQVWVKLLKAKRYL
ncbi:GDSL-type esterase/lipase family protein [Chryseolinea soli]|uniref:GDSL family lipase n=1 Tax=Chryseolinea soli TaxID=2321403 RepID=A0A385SQ57_9BACT|nr:GDSL-type esterase/lipase family protein [Chryseolinea soli]AYB31640.1 GDSL family lipase [Chryseolinea soli]